MTTLDQDVLAIAPHYDILHELGSGGMGRVLLAYDQRLDRHVAIKRLHRPADAEGLSERFLHEARAVARLNHPNIVAIYDVGEANGHSYMVMEYVQGRTLEAMIQDAPRIPASLCAAVGVQICSALDYTHQHGIIHRDIKPANLILSRQGLAKLTDFGIVKQTGSGLVTIEQAGAAIGTLKYASPEQLLDASQVGPGSDLYSLAVTLFEMLTGEHPYEANSPSEFIRQVFHASPPALREVYFDIPQAFEDILLKAMARDPAARFSRAAEMGEALAALIDNDHLQRILSGPLFNMRNFKSEQAQTFSPVDVGSTHADLRLVPDSRRLLASLRQDLSWLQAFSQLLPQRESRHLPKAAFLERVLTSAFSGLIQLNHSVWALVQNGYFLEFVSDALTPHIDKSGEEIFEILPSQLEQVKLYPTGAKQHYLPLLLANLIQSSGQSTVERSDLREISALPELLSQLPDLTGALICKNAEMLYCLGYSQGQAIFALELHAEKVCLTEITLDQILGRSHTLWDFYVAELRLADLNQTVLLSRAQGQRQGETFSYHFALNKPDTSILNQLVSAQSIVIDSRLHRFVCFWLKELLPRIQNSGQQQRLAPLLCTDAVTNWTCHQQIKTARAQISLDLCAADLEHNIRLCLRQGEGDAQAVEAFLSDINALRELPRFSALNVAVLLAPGTFTHEALAVYARQQALGHYQICLVEYAQHEQLFKLVAPSLYG